MANIFCSMLLIAGLVILPLLAGTSYSQTNHPEPTSRGDKRELPGTFSSASVAKSADLEKTASGGTSVRQESQEDKQDLMDEALDLINESENHWKKGDIEIALEFLDQAYSLVLSANGSADISRQKDDLRLLISRRILAIYSATKFTVTNGKASQIPLALNDDVEKEIRSFQTTERNFFIQSYRRSAFYLPIITRELRRAGLPLELAWLPLVESGYKISALSSARALGLWQFIPSTGYQYGLNRNEWIDERMDLEKSTTAAIAYLSELHRMFGDWLTALAAYNCGEGRLLRVISRQRINYFDRFWDLYHQLPYETARYVPRFLATLHIINDPAKYGFDFNSEQSDRKITYIYEKVRINRSMRLQDIAQQTETSEELLNILNAELRRKVTPNAEYDLKLPPEAVERFNEIQDNIPSVRINPKKVARHRIKKGETIDSIARIYSVPPKVIRESNPSAAKKRLVAGQLIRVPIREEDAFTIVGNNGQAESPQKSAEESKNKSNEGSVAKGNKLSAVEPKTTSKNQPATLKTVAARTVSKASVKPSQKIKLASAAKKQAEDQSGQIKTYVVQKGDNLNIVARKFNTSVNALTKLNTIREHNIIQPGQKIQVR